MSVVDICMKCMAFKNGQNKCTKCGYVNGSEPDINNKLPEGSLLKHRYTLGALLGNGGFSNTYIGWDSLLETKVAIKEYLPAEFVSRCPANRSVRPIMKSYAALFEKGKKTFLDEAKILASFENVPGIVNIRDFFKENNTAYLVMEYLEGMSLDAHLSKIPRGRLPEKEALRMLLPVVQILKKVHQAGLIHRDISPDNIIITCGGIIKLIDFGASREFEKANMKTKTIIVKQGYAPPEQYAKNGNQGEWTDIYALGATFYKLVTGKTPPDSLNRMLGEEQKSVSNLGIAISDKNDEAITKAMAIEPSARFKNIAEFEHALETYDLNKHEVAVDVEKQKTKLKLILMAPIVASLTLIMALGLSAFAYYNGLNGNSATPSPTPNAFLAPMVRRTNGTVATPESTAHTPAPTPEAATPTPAPAATPSPTPTGIPPVEVVDEEVPATGGTPTQQNEDRAAQPELHLYGGLLKTGIDRTSQVIFKITNLDTGGYITAGYDNLAMDPESTSYMIQSEIPVKAGQQLQVTVFFDADKSGTRDENETYSQGKPFEYTGQETLGMDFSSWHNSQYKYSINHIRTENPDGTISLVIEYPQNAVIKEYKRETAEHWTSYEGGELIFTEDAYILTRSLDESGNESTGSVLITIPEVPQNDLQDETPVKEYISFQRSVNADEGTTTLIISYPAGSTDRQYKTGGGEWTDFTGGGLVLTEDAIVHARAMGASGNEVTTSQTIYVYWPPTQNTEGSLVPDPYLNAVIRKRLNKPEGEITKDELAGIINLDANDLGITSIEGLQYCTSLTNLNLPRNSITDISPLAGLSSIEFITLINNPIIDISPLANLETLEFLNMEHCTNISDFSALGTLVNLERLFLSVTRLPNIDFAYGTKNLTHLGINATKVKDISPLVNCTNLYELSSAENAIADYSPLKNLQNLERLEIEGVHDWDDFEFIN